jgi:hypothetical protein
MEHRPDRSPAHAGGIEGRVRMGLARERWWHHPIAVRTETHDHGPTVTLSKGAALSLRTFLNSLFSRSRSDQHVERYIVREHERGRPFAEIMEDAYVRNRTTEEQRARIVERPEVIAAMRRNLASGATVE